MSQLSRRWALLLRLSIVAAVGVYFASHLDLVRLGTALIFTR
jgi:hypothetical protein